jgi:hypothetical protein
MYDALTTRYTFACPARGEAQVRLSSFRVLDRLPGSAHPAVFQIVFDCQCGDEHPGLVSDAELDWAPLGLSEERYLNLMTARFEETAEELSDLAVRRILSGDWPWSFYCYPEDRPRPVFPSSFFLLTPGDGSVGLAVRCPVCERVSVNLVSPEHVDLPFHNDREIGVVPHVFGADATRLVDEFRSELDSGRFDARRLHLD